MDDLSLLKLAGGLEANRDIVRDKSELCKTDTELLRLYDQFIKLERQGQVLSQIVWDGGDASDIARETLLQKQKNIVCQSRCFDVVTPAGLQALARMLLVWSSDIKPSNRDSDSVEDQLLWLLLRNLLGVEHATALASDDPNIVLEALSTL